MFVIRTVINHHPWVMTSQIGVISRAPRSQRQERIILSMVTELCLATKFPPREYSSLPMSLLLLSHSLHNNFIQSTKISLRRLMNQPCLIVQLVQSCYFATTAQCIDNAVNNFYSPIITCSFIVILKKVKHFIEISKNIT